LILIAKDTRGSRTSIIKTNPKNTGFGKGEQGVLICEPYKSEIGQFWRFRTPEVAKESSEKIFNMFSNYLQANDFVGADMARKYLQMVHPMSLS